VLTIGNFDGVHIGHQALIQKNLAKAKTLGLASTIFTFEPHPRVVLQPDNHPPRILSLKDKLSLIEQLGVDHVVVEPFDKVFSMHPAHWFAQEIVAKRMRSKAMIVGHDFRFGKGRGGNAEVLGQLLPNIPIESLNAIKIGEDIASSSRIRERVATGDVEGAKSLLGRPYWIHGQVVTGAGRGKQLGFPTANLDIHSELIPARGVYAVEVDHLEKRHRGVANLGLRPTFGKHAFCMEVHLLDFNQDLYGEELSVRFIQHIRPECSFDSADALSAQIQQDIKSAKKILAS